MSGRLDTSFTLSFCPGLGLAVVARIVEQLGGQLRIDSQVNAGSKFSFLIPLALASDKSEVAQFSSRSTGSQPRSRTASEHSSSCTSEIDGLVEALATSHMSPRTSAQYDTSLPPIENVPSSRNGSVGTVTSSRGILEVQSLALPIRPVKVDYLDQEVTHVESPSSNRTSITEAAREPTAASNVRKPTAASGRPCPRESKGSAVEKLRILVVEVSQQSIYLQRVFKT